MRVRDLSIHPLPPAFVHTLFYFLGFQVLGFPSAPPAAALRLGDFKVTLLPPPLPHLATFAFSVLWRARMLVTQPV